ncbi:DUF11 domain-containing protein [Clostridium sp. P21]|uniref:DUF11 domain-containing protein n=1 Tax=Clostridium muellerianum TaxID=2716538 RepID=A0A7Y0HMY7_9CLOT|nr:DUF11 domain-containing protein [Clostridium muellerianum]NMM62655.1 DUF11 domain-containing protein [Clostridium muellerianum]
MALTNHFSAIDKAMLVATGNTLVVCGSTTVPAVNTSDLIKPDGSTTRDWMKSGSSAVLNILEGSIILYAELVWYSTVKSNVSGSLDLRSVQDNAITFATSKGNYQITPQYTDSYTGASGSIDRYRAADVTTYVQDALTGNYTVSNVPISVPSEGLSNSRAGWSLAVIYRNNAFQPQKIIYNSGIAAATSETPLQTTITGFTTSAVTENLKANVFMASANGEPLNGNEIVYAGPSFAQLSNIGNTVNTPNPNPTTAPNNPGNSFFSGVINTANPLSSVNGLLNINGTNGTINHDGFVPTQTLGGRNKWDITNVDISNTLVTNQSLLAGQITENTSGDGVQLVALGVQVLAKAPNIIIMIDAYDIDGDKEYNVEVGEPLVYAIHIKNDGDVEANNVIVSAVLDSSTSFIPGSVVINEVKNSTANIVNGINVGTISARGIVNLLFTVKVNEIPSGELINQNVNYSYQFVSGIDTVTNSGKTKTIQVVVQDGLLNIEKSASKNNVNISETVTYTVNISNVGTETAKNLFFQDKINSSCSFVEETVVIDGTPYTDYDPSVGFSLPDLLIGKSTQILFKIKVNSLPSSTKINSVSFITFGYIYNQYGYSREKTAVSNAVSIQVQYIDIIGKRCNDNNYPNIGEIVIYTLSLTNMGNLPASNVKVLEPLIPGTTFVTGSVKINGTLDAALDPFNGFTLENVINPKQTTTVEYKVLVNSINPANLIENIAQVPFKYQISPSESIIETEKESNKVDTVANYVCMNVVKSVDKAYGEIGSTLYYTINVSNNGNINSTDTVFLDSIQAEASFVTGSVAINGISYPAYDPTQGFTIGTICAGDNIEVTFQAKVKTLPSPNIICNNSSLVYSYKPDPNGINLTNTVSSNTVETIINEAQYSVIKKVDKMYAQVGDILVYTTTVQNTGTVTLNDMKFADFIGAYLSFYPQSVYIDGVNKLDFNPSNQFSIGNMAPGDTRTIVFKTSIVGNPTIGYISNTSEVTLSYKQNPDNPIITKTVYSNTTATYVPYAAVSLIKTVDKAFGLVGDSLTYSFTATNTGNTAAINTLFTDIIQSEASFVQGSVIVNGVSKTDYNPQTGFSLGKMEAGQVATVEFKVIVNSVPTPNTIKNNATVAFGYYVDPNKQTIANTTTSNTVTTVINSYSAALTKVVDKSYAAVRDVLQYTVTATNTGTVSLTNVYFTDIVPNGAEFVEGSVIMDGVSKPDFNPNKGFAINDVLPGGNVVVMFKATVTSVLEPPKISNIAHINFKYQLTPTLPYINSSLTSNTVTTNVVSMSVINTKSVSKAYATVGDSLTYTSVINNKSNVSITNTEFIDVVPAHTTFVLGTVKIDGTPYTDYDPNKGFTIGTLNAASKVTITFDVTVDSVPNESYIINSSVINYQYKINPSGSYITASANSNEVTTYINLGNLTITKDADRSIVRLTDIINYNFVIANTGNTVLKNLSFKDVIQAESSFNSGSVYVNGVNKPNYNPNTGFNLDDILIGQETTVSFKVTTNSVPSGSKLLNSADVNYSYYVDPNETPKAKTKTSNTTTVYVYDTIVSANKEVDKSLAKIGDTLNFTVTVKNEGNVSVQHVVFKDVLDTNISFVTDSVYINGAQKIGYNPNNGFNLDDITAGSTTTVTFAAKVAKRPEYNIVYNYTAINYDYTVGTEVVTANINTNTTQTYIAVGELTITKSVDKLYATVGDNIAYTIMIKNTGSVNATNLSFKDLIPASTSFNSGTVVVDGNSQLDFNPDTGFTLTDLTPNQYHVVGFNIHVDSLPQNGNVENTADVSFSYRLTQTDDSVTTTITSNKVTTLIKLGNLTAAKAVDKLYATIENTLNYTITINNTGNAYCIDVFFKDIIQSDASFVTGSVKIDDLTYSDYNPNNGFNLGNIKGHGNTVVTFAVTVKTLPKNYTIDNYAIDNYKYYIDPSNPPVVKEGKTNTVTTVINVGALTAIKSVSKAYATIDDVITYTVNVINTGNTTIKNVNFRDVIPNGLTFVPESVTINGTAYSNYNPYASFTLGNIISGDTVVVEFDTKVTSLPTPSLISNTANIVFYYRIDPSGNDIAVQVNSNTVTTQINVGSITVNKSVDKVYAAAGDILTYTVVLTNTGNIREDNVIFTDELQADVTFNEGSVKVNGTTHPDYNPNSGFSLGNIESLDHVTIIFTVTVIDSPNNQTLLNYAEGTFSYKIDPNGQYYTKSTQSNTVSTMIIMPNLTAAKTVDKLYEALQEVLNYSVLVKNAGNTAISQLFFTDFLSNGAVFKSGSVLIDGVSYSNYNPVMGFNLPNNLLAGATTLIKFQAAVTTLPSPPQVTNYAAVNGIYHVDPTGSTYPITANSNTVTTNINLGSLSNTKTVDKMYAKVNDTITYTSTITNTGNVIVSDLFFTDAMQSELTYISGTVSINGVVYPSLDPTNGFELSNLAPGQSVIIEFNAKINELPTPAYVTNSSLIQFSYKVDPNGSTIIKNQASNTVITNVVLGKINAVKIVNKSIATIGDELIYTVTLTNVGNVIDSNVFFQDTPSKGTTFKAGSVKIDNISKPNYDPTVGFTIGDIGIGNVVTVTFIATVVSVPDTNQVTNQAAITFEFLIDPKQPVYTETIYSNTVTTNIAYGNLSVTKVVNKQYATIGEQLTYTIKIVNIGNINATNIVFLDPIPRNSTFVLGSVTINGISYTDYNPSAGFNLNTMVPGQIIIVVYKVQLVNLC